MDDELRKTVAEIGELVKSLPAGIQEKAFEILLNHELRKQPARAADGGGSGGEEKKKEKQEQTKEDSRGGEDITTSDLHLKMRKFLQKQGLSLDHLNELFYKEEGELKPLFEDLKTTKASESQIRLALLSSLRNAIQTGEFEFSGEDVRQQCQARKTYDSTNFTTNFRNNARFFEKFTEYDKNKPQIRLSEEGRKALGALIEELQ
jgi:hypothetical protein